ncbi:MAG: hypothetical protein ACFE9N_13135 [Promethearchaeota archaeon]
MSDSERTFTPWDQSPNGDNNLIIFFKVVTCGIIIYLYANIHKKG